MHRRAVSYRCLGLALLAVACCVGCGREAPVRELTIQDEGILEAWEDVFPEGNEIELEVPETGPRLLQVGKVLRRRDGTLVIPDGRAKRILFFRPDGALLKQVAGGDNGAFQLSILRTADLDDDDNLLVFDPDGASITVLRAPEYDMFRRFQIPTSLADILALPDGSSLAYSPTEEEVFQRFDQTGRRLGAAYRVRDERLRLFHARIQTGGITRTSGGEVVGIHPAAFELVRMSPTLDVLEIVRAPEGSSWHPHPVELPEYLSPYDYTPLHEDWWNTFDHIGTIHSLDEDLLLVTVFSSDGLRDWTESVNIYELGEDVRLLAGGLRVPHRGRIVGAAERDVYIVRNARMEDDESLQPLALYRYRLGSAFP